MFTNKKLAGFIAYVELQLMRRGTTPTEIKIYKRKIAFYQADRLIYVAIRKPA